MVFSKSFIGIDSSSVRWKLGSVDWGFTGRGHPGGL